jgi:succinate dehydrogenase / fumarate reductase cytochrome b subunit
MTQATLSIYPWRASIVKKQFMALTGLMMCGFLLIHLAGNLLIFNSPEVFNQYAFFMLNNPIIMVLEWLLALLFLFHAVLGLFLIVENLKARPTRYALRVTQEKGSNISFLSMSWTGPLMLIFLLLHLLHFKFGTEYWIIQGDLEIRDLHRTVAEYFANLINVLLYSIAMVLVALHVQHGVWSAFQSFGFNHPRYNHLLELGASVYALVIFVGFIAIPLSYVKFD